MAIPQNVNEADDKFLEISERVRPINPNTEKIKVNQSASTKHPDNNDIEEPRLRAEYAIWKKNTPFLYDMIITSRLPWPSLTVEWFPEVELVSTALKPTSTSHTPKGISSLLSRYKILLGTQTSGNAYEYVRIGVVDLPNLNAISGEAPLSLLNKYDTILNEFGGYQTSQSQFKVHQYLDHNGEVNRARYCPQNPSIIATGSSNCKVYIFDCTKHPLDPRHISQASKISTESSSDFSSKVNTLGPRPEMILDAHTNEVSSISWNSYKYGYLASGSYDSTVCVWNIRNYSRTKKHAPLNLIQTHKNLVNDIEWHKFSPSIIGSVSDDGMMHIHDLRVPEITYTPQLATNPKSFKNDSENSYKTVGINCISFNNANENLVATGGTDSNISLWDLRSLNHTLHTMKGHADNVNAVEWSHHEPTILASASSDRRVCIWDASAIDKNVSFNDENQFTPSPELLWVHGGHTESVSDISWNPALPWVLASVSNDNNLHIFKPSQQLVKAK